MEHPIDQHNLHRTAKYFMDSGRAETPEAAMELLYGFGLTIHVGEEITESVHHQTALLTLVNTARRTLLAGIEIVGLPDVPSVTPLAPHQQLRDAVRELSGRIVPAARSDWPAAVIGTIAAPTTLSPCWRLTWGGWRGGIVPIRDDRRLAETNAIPLAPVVAAAACAAEAFTYHARDHVMAGRRAQGFSMWNPGADWLTNDPSEPALVYLPLALWIIGLGNLGQAFAWILACLPYEDRGRLQLVLQDFDYIEDSNDSTSLLSFLKDTGDKKARVVADWLEARGFQTILEERHFGKWTQRAEHEPNVALFGVDNANARAVVEHARFGLIIEAGLGAGPQAFRNISIHTFPASRTAESIWLKQIGQQAETPENMPAYQALKNRGMDRCGLTQLAARTVGVPFVGLIAACLVFSELLRRVHGGTSFELLSVSAGTLQDMETVAMKSVRYEFGHVTLTTA